MYELKRYIEILRTIINGHYEKEMIFYNDGEWYSRYHSRNIEIDELENWIFSIVGTSEDELEDED